MTDSSLPSMAKAIETMFAGVLFRSRLEARWAVFFDELRIRWQYEPEGFLVGAEQRPYLPDFLLPELNVWVEVKGSGDQLDLKLLDAAIDYGLGLPHVECMSDEQSDVGGLLLLGPIPRPEHRGLPVHPLLQHHKGTVLQWIHFTPTGISRQEHRYDGISISDETVPDYRGRLLESTMRAVVDYPQVNAAYSAARSARFEHTDREVWSP